MSIICSKAMVYTYTKKSTVYPAAILNSTGKLNQHNKILLQECFFASISFCLLVYQIDYQKLAGLYSLRKGDSRDLLSIWMFLL